MVATRANGDATTSPHASIPDNSVVYTATDCWTSGLHWTRYVPREPRPGAKTLVLVHGASHNEFVWTLGPTNWVNFFTRLGHDVIVVSLSGHRPSKGSVTFKRMRRYVQDAHRPVEVLGLADEEVVYIAHSMGAVVSQLLLAQYPRIGGCVIVDCVAVHRCLNAYLPALVPLLRRHPRTFLAATLNPAALFGSDALVRKLLLGEEASDEVVTAIRQHLGGETSLAMLSMLAAKLKGRLPLDGKKVLFLSARGSAFFPPWMAEASARDYGAQFVAVEGAHNIMLTESALPAAQVIATFVASLELDHAPQQNEEARR